MAKLWTAKTHQLFCEPTRGRYTGRTISNDSEGSHSCIGRVCMSCDRPAPQRRLDRACALGFNSESASQNPTRFLIEPRTAQISFWECNIRPETRSRRDWIREMRSKAEFALQGRYQRPCLQATRRFKPKPTEVPLQRYGTGGIGGRGGTGRGSKEALNAETSVSFHVPATRVDEGFSKDKYGPS